MAEPRIQYAKTSDGVSIAYATAGTGPSLLLLPVPGICHLEKIWDVSGYVMQPLADTFHLIWYDSRGCGLSDRHAMDFSIDSMILDLEAVARSAEIPSFALVGWGDGVPTAIKYAATQPDSLTHLVLMDGWAKFTDYSVTPAYQIEAALRDKDWVLSTEAFFQALGYDDPAYGRRMAELVRASVRPDVWQTIQEALEAYDVSSYLEQIATPTLVVHNREHPWVPLEVGQKLASSIPGASLAIAGSLDLSAAPTLIREFVGTGLVTEEPVSTGAAGMTAILFADIVDSTGLTERLGDAAFRGKARDLDASLRTIIRDHDGTPIEGKLLGDGVLATFSSASQAIEAALRCGAAGDDCGLQLHLGIHAGDVIREENNVCGGAVNIAARIAGASAPGEVLVSQTVRDLARTSAAVSFEDRGRKTLKGVEGRQRLFEARREPGPAGGEP